MTKEIRAYWWPEEEAWRVYEPGRPWKALAYIDNVMEVLNNAKDEGYDAVTFEIGLRGEESERQED